MLGGFPRLGFGFLWFGEFGCLVLFLVVRVIWYFGYFRVWVCDFVGFGLVMVFTCYKIEI